MHTFDQWLVSYHVTRSVCTQMQVHAWRSRKRRSHDVLHLRFDMWLFVRSCASRPVKPMLLSHAMLKQVFPSNQILPWPYQHSNSATDLQLLQSETSKTNVLSNLDHKRLIFSSFAGFCKGPLPCAWWRRNGRSDVLYQETTGSPPVKCQPKEDDRWVMIDDCCCVSSGACIPDEKIAPMATNRSISKSSTRPSVSWSKHGVDKLPGMRDKRWHASTSLCCAD